jgi:hypothetical protein
LPESIKETLNLVAFRLRVPQPGDIRTTKNPVERSVTGLLLFPCADRTGLEPATSCVTGRHSNQLNYRSFSEWSAKIAPATFYPKVSEKHFRPTVFEKCKTRYKFFVCSQTNSTSPMDEGSFNRLSLDDRAKLLWEKGKFVESVTYYNYCLILYSLNREFVELFYDKSSQSILWISFANEYDMKKYLNKIEIPV